MLSCCLNTPSQRGRSAPRQTSSVPQSGTKLHFWEQANECNATWCNTTALVFSWSHRDHLYPSALLTGEAMHIQSASLPNTTSYTLRSHKNTWRGPAMLLQYSCWCLSTTISTLKMVLGDTVLHTHDQSHSHVWSWRPVLPTCWKHSLWFQGSGPHLQTKHTTLTPPPFCSI